MGAKETGSNRNGPKENTIGKNQILNKNRVSVYTITLPADNISFDWIPF